jgi:5-methylcytosine-specific restriction protein A
MNRKQFILSHNAKCANWTWSWSFVNHEDKVVIFGVWDENILNSPLSTGSAIILSPSWEMKNGRYQPGYAEAAENINRILNEQYKLQVFEMEYTEKGGNVKIGKIIGKLFNKRLFNNPSGDWCAV